jgi:hypothetical protein
MARTLRTKSHRPKQNTIAGAYCTLMEYFAPKNWIDKIHPDTDLPTFLKHIITETKENTEQTTKSCESTKTNIKSSTNEPPELLHNIFPNLAFPILKDKLTELIQKTNIKISGRPNSKNKYYIGYGPKTCKLEKTIQAGNLIQNQPTSPFSESKKQTPTLPLPPKL